MDLETIWDKFITQLNCLEYVNFAKWKKVSGIPFLYIRVRTPIHKESLEKNIRIFAAKSMKGKQLHCETIFVRQEDFLYVYRHRFYVPQQKMFCCGNVCDDCIRLRPTVFW